MPAFLSTRTARGELAEVLFSARALRLGYEISKPYSAGSAYDWVVGGRSRRLKRVQVKSAWVADARGQYSVPAGSNAYPVYTADEIDFLVAYVGPEDAWYVIPVAALGSSQSLTLHPRDPLHDPWGRFRETWWRLGKPRRPRGTEPVALTHRSVSNVVHPSPSSTTMQRA